MKRELVLLALVSILGACGFEDSGSAETTVVTVRPKLPS